MGELVAAMEEATEGAVMEGAMEEAMAAEKGAVRV